MFKGLRQWHRLDHTLIRKMRAAGDYNLGDSEWLGLILKLHYMSSLAQLDGALQAMGLPSTQGNPSAVPARFDWEDKCLFQAIRDYDGVDMMLEEGLGSIQARGCPYILGQVSGSGRTNSYK